MGALKAEPEARVGYRLLIWKLFSRGSRESKIGQEKTPPAVIELGPAVHKWGSIPLGHLQGLTERTSQVSLPKQEARVFIHKPRPHC